MSSQLLHLLVAVGLVAGGHGFGRAAVFILRHPSDWWTPERLHRDLFVSAFVIPSVVGRTLLGLGPPGRAGTLAEAAVVALVAALLFAGTAAALVF